MDVTMIRVLLVDDQQAVRRGLRFRLRLEPDIEVVGEAGSGQEALLLAQTLAPTVVLMDVEMPGMDGIATTNAIQSLSGTSAVVMLSIHDDVVTRAQAQAAGAMAFVAKGSTTDQLIATIRRVAGQAGSTQDIP
jgi:DNA-binding NarL/FixJ family response regulator